MDITNYIQERILELKQEVRSPKHPTLSSSIDLTAGQIIALQAVLSKIEELGK